MVVDPTLAMAVVGGLDAALVLAGMVLLTGARTELRFVACRCARPDCAGFRREWVALS